MRGEVSPWEGRAPDSGDASTLVFCGHVPQNTVVAAAPSTIVWTEDVDTHGAYGGGTGILTIPAGMGGLYQLSLAWKPSTAIGISMTVHLNGANAVTTPGGGNAAAFTGMAATLIIPVPESVGLTVRSNATFTTTNDTTFNTWLHVVRLRS